MWLRRDLIRLTFDIITHQQFHVLLFTPVSCFLIWNIRHSLTKKSTVGWKLYIFFSNPLLSFIPVLNVLCYYSSFVLNMLCFLGVPVVNYIQVMWFLLQFLTYYCLMLGRKLRRILVPVKVSFAVSCPNNRFEKVVGYSWHFFISFFSLLIFLKTYWFVP